MKTEVRRQKVFFDKNVLSYGSSIGKVKLCVKTKAITLFYFTSNQQHNSVNNKLLFDGASMGKFLL